MLVLVAVGVLDVAVVAAVVTVSSAADKGEDSVCSMAPPDLGTGIDLGGLLAAASPSESELCLHFGWPLNLTAAISHLHLPCSNSDLELQVPLEADAVAVSCGKMYLEVKSVMGEVNN